MSIKHRIRRMEQKAGQDADPLVVVIPLFGDGREGEIGTAVVTWPNRTCETLSRREGESNEAFQMRIDMAAGSQVA